MDTIQTHPRRSANVAARLFDGEAIVISPEENIVRMFNRTGSRIWELADGTRSACEIASLLCVEYDITQEDAAPQVEAFITQLADRGLIETS